MKGLRPVFWLEAMAGVALLAMMLLVVVDVAGRYLFATPLAGAIELVQFAMVIAVFGGLPAASLRGRHISLDILQNRLRGRARRWHQGALCLGAAAVLAAQAWLLWDIAGSMRRNADVIGYLNLPTFPAAYFMCALSLITAAVLAWCGLRGAADAHAAT
ncbi:MAG: TRAP transporter small permease [Lautropia sp.]